MSDRLYENDQVTDREAVANYLRQIAQTVEAGNQLPFGPDERGDLLTPTDPMSFSVRSRAVDDGDLDVQLSLSLSWASADTDDGDTPESEADRTREKGGTRRGADVATSDAAGGALAAEQADLPPPSAGTRNAEKASHEFDRARHFMGKGKTKAANSRFQHAIKADPADAEIRQQFANFLWRNERPERARRQFDHALELAPDNAALRIDVANFHWSQGSQDAANEQFERALELAPESPDVHSTYGRFLWEELESIERAVEHLKRALELDETHPLAHLNFATLLRHGGRMDRAEEHYESALEYGENNATIHNEYGHYLWANGEVEEAAREYAKARQLDPNAGD